MEITEIRRTERRKREAENGKGKTEKMEITEIRRTKRKKREAEKWEGQNGKDGNNGNKKNKKKDEASLDLYEGYPNFYDKQMLEIELDGKIVPAMVYVMTPGHSFGIPSDYYSNVIWQGYETAGFETQFLEDAIEHAYQLVQKQEREGDFGCLREDKAGRN